MSEQKRYGISTGRSLFRQKKKVLFHQSLFEAGTVGYQKLGVKNHPNADALNRLIYEFVAAIEKKELELWQQGKRISLELLKNMLTTQENNSSFISFFKQEVTNSSLKNSTKRNHLSTLMLLQEFKKDRI